MIDLHCHILPGLDDGAPDAEVSLAMARAAADDGVRVIVATPHVNADYDASFEVIGRRVGELNILLGRAEIALAVLVGAEIDVAKLGQMTDERLGQLSLGTGPAVLVESPYLSTVPFLEDALFGIQLRGFRPVLAHPERSPLFQEDPERLARLVERGMLCSVNAGSLAGAFGARVQRFTVELFRRRLVHDVSSDAHDASDRRPVLRAPLRSADRRLRNLSGQSDWFLRASAYAILAGEPVSEPPALLPRRSVWGWLTRRT